ncbi:MAG: hypothetical protein N2595_01465 [bacterium]|nr:hypothetical protein [bacterium]
MGSIGEWNSPIQRAPDFSELLAVLRRERPRRPVLFELFLNTPLYRMLAGEEVARAYDAGELTWEEVQMWAMRNAGYDYVTVRASTFEFPRREQHCEKTLSLNEGAVITDRASFEALSWTEPDGSDWSMLDKLGSVLPEGMKLIVYGPGGVLENVVRMVGYENLCLLLADDPEFVAEIFDAVGSRLLRYYELCVRHPAVGAIVSNDDWGFKSQTMVSPADLRRYVFPWHARIVAVAHAAGKPAILHSCGNLSAVMDDVIEVMRFDAKHSYEDTIQPVEEAYEQYCGRIAILGGIDVNFVCRATAQEVYERSRGMVERGSRCGGYALGTGNSVPEYVPQKNYFAMIQAAWEEGETGKR